MSPDLKISRAPAYINIQTGKLGPTEDHIILSSQEGSVDLTATDGYLRNRIDESIVNRRLEEAAEALGKTVEEIRQELEMGKTITW